MIASMACVEAFSNPTEDKEKVLKAIKTLTDVVPEEKKNKSRFGGDLIVLRACMKQEEDIMELIKKLRGLDINFKAHTDKRVFNIMLNKQRAFLGEIVPGRGLKVTIRFSKEAFKQGFIDKLSD